MKSILSAVVGATLALSAIEAGAQATPRERQVSLTIESTSLAAALDTWAQQSGFQIFVQDWEAAKNLPARSLKGTFAAQDALDQLLSGTPLTYVWISDKAVSIRRKMPQTVPTALQRTSLEGPQAIPVAKFSGDAGSTASPRGSDLGSQKQAMRGASSAERLRGEEFEEIVVTGTHLRGVESPVGGQLIEITRKDIERSGYGTVQEVIRSLPQNFGGGANEDLSGIDGGGAGPNLGFGSGANLRGLGNDSTLVLVDGRRFAPSGGAANFVDLSSVPLTAVERIEVLPDGASALYGSDAVGGVVNIITRRNYSGADSRVRLGSVTSGDSTDLQFGQVLGISSDAGGALVAYEFDRHSNLASKDRSFANDSDLTRFGGDDFSSQASNPGNITDFVTNYAIPHGQDGRDLTPAQLSTTAPNLQNTRAGTDILPEQTKNSVFLTGDRRLTDSIELFADARYSRRESEYRVPAASGFIIVPATNPYFVDPFGGSPVLFMNYSFLDDLGPQVQESTVDSYGGTLGLAFDIGGDWRLEFSGSHSTEETASETRNAVNQTALDAALADPNPATAFNPFGDGSNTNAATLAAIAARDKQDVDSRLWTGYVKADGSLGHLPGGDVKLALGAEYRAESFSYQSVSAAGRQTTNEGDRHVAAAFAELRLPLFGRENARRGLEQLELSLAGRTENYSDFGSTTNPQLGVLWSPLRGMSFHGSIGRSFKAPLLGQLTGRTQTFLVPLPDSQSQTGVTNTLALTGLKDGLTPEKAETWTLGIAFQSQNRAAFSAGVNYFHTRIKDRIKLAVSNFISALAQDDIYAPVVTRSPDSATVTAIFNSPDFIGSPIPPDQVGAIIDGRVQNVGVNEIDGVDASVEANFDVGEGAISLGLSGTYFLDLKQGITSSAPLIEQVSTLGNPTDLKLRGGISWATGGGFEFSAFLNYVDAYTDEITNLASGRPPVDIGSWTTVDVQLAYSGAPMDLAAAISVQNALDRDPPFVNAFGVGYDALNASPFGRFVSVQVTKRW